MKRLPLLHYVAATTSRPLRLQLRWSFEPGRDRLEIDAAPHPALKKVSPGPSPSSNTSPSPSPSPNPSPNPNTYRAPRRANPNPNPSPSPNPNPKPKPKPNQVSCTTGWRG